jgi:hypothetical protein
MSTPSHSLPTFVFTIKVTDEGDPELDGCFATFWVWAIPIHRLVAFTPDSLERIALNIDTLLRLVHDEPGCTPYPVLSCPDLSDVVFLVHRWRLWKPPNCCYGERWWTPEGREGWATVGSNPGRVGEQEAKQVWRWWRRTRLQNRRGRLPGGARHLRKCSAQRGSSRGMVRW